MPVRKIIPILELAGIYLKQNIDNYIFIFLKWPETMIFIFYSAMNCLVFQGNLFRLNF